LNAGGALETIHLYRHLSPVYLVVQPSFSSQPYYIPDIEVSKSAVPEEKSGVRDIDKESRGRGRTVFIEDEQSVM